MIAVDPIALMSHRLQWPGLLCAEPACEELADHLLGMGCCPRVAPLCFWHAFEVSQSWVAGESLVVECMVCDSLSSAKWVGRRKAVAA